MVKIGDILVHPAHGEMVVKNVGIPNYEEYIEEEKDFIKGHQITAVFDRFIPGVKWVLLNGEGNRVSKLIFHSYYLKNLKLKGQ